MRQAETVLLARDIPATVLVNTAEVSIQPSGTTTWHRKYAVRISTASGIKYGLLSQSVNEHVRVSGLRGWLVSNGKSTDLQKSRIFERAASTDNGAYDQERILFAGFSQLLVGDVAAYEWDIEERTPFDRYWHAFQLQEELPVLVLALAVRVPTDWGLRWAGQNTDSLAMSRTGDSYHWTTQYLAARLVEPHMIPTSAAARQVSFMAAPALELSAEVSEGWQVASRQAWVLQDSSAVGSDLVCAKAEQLSEGLPDLAGRILAVTQFVRDSIRYVAVEIGRGRFVPRLADQTLTVRYGDCKDKVALLRGLLKCLGVSSWPVLAAVGKPICEDLPNVFQFNHCIAALPDSCIPPNRQSGNARLGDLMLFDPTSESTELGELPPLLHESSVLVARETEGALEHTGASPSSAAQRCVRADLRLVAPDRFEGRVHLCDHGLLARESRRRLIGTLPAQLTEQLTAWLATTVSSPVVSAVAWQSDGDSTWQDFSVTGERILLTVGEKQLMKIDIFAQDTPTPLDPATRQHPFSFGVPHIMRTTIRWTLLPARRAADLPAPVERECDNARFTCTMVADGDTITYDKIEEYRGGAVSTVEAASMCAWISALETISARRLALIAQ